MLIIFHDRSILGVVRQADETDADRDVSQALIKPGVGRDRANGCRSFHPHEKRGQEKISGTD